MGIAHLLFTRQGRINRAKYWLTIYLAVATAIVSSMLLSIELAILRGTPAPNQYGLDSLQKVA